MNIADQIAAKQYLLEPSGGFWKWTTQGDAIQWFDGATIAFLPELTAVLKHLASDQARGLPPLGSVLLLIAATRKNWWENGSVPEHRIEHLKKILLVQGSAYLRLDIVRKKLNKVHKLEDDVKSSLLAKQTLAEIIFRNCKSLTTPTVATEVLRILDGGIEEIFEGDQAQRPDAEQSLLADLSVLHYEVRGISAEMIRLRIATSADEVPIATTEDVELPDELTVKGLLSSMEKDSDYFGLARAAQQLMSVMSLPKPISHPQDQEEGGVCDITNRGPLDRLLLSELANDELTLAVRIAMNEAMYLRREAPPQPTRRQQIVVLDSGIRTWGMPRFLGCSLALAFASQVKAEGEFSAFTIDDSDLLIVRLNSRAGITSHLKMLRPQLHPGQSLTALVDLLNQREGDCEVVLITSEDVVENFDFRSAIDQSQLLGNPNLGSLHLGSIGRDGTTKLIEVSSRGRKLIKQAKIDIEQIFKNPPSSTTPNNSAFPAIFSANPFPLLLSASYKSEKRLWPMGDAGLAVLTNDRRILFWEDTNFGGRQLTDRLMASDVWWSSDSSTGSLWSAVIGNPQSDDFRLLTLDLETFQLESVPLDIKERPIAFCSHQTALFVVDRTGVARIDKSTGKSSLYRLKLTQKHARGRFFVDSEQNWFALASDSHAPLLEPVPLPIPREEVVTIMEVPHIEGPIVFSQRGVLHPLNGDDPLDLGESISGPFRPSDIKYDGGRLLIKDVTTTQSLVMVDTTTAKLTKTKHYINPSTTPHILRFRKQVQTRHRFVSISIREDGAILLRSRKQFQFEFAFIGKQILLKNFKSSGQNQLEIPFKATSNSPEASKSGAPSPGFKLQTARWPDGSVAWLDSRGLLHLKSSDITIPEITIVLKDGRCSGWCSDGEVWGQPYFVGVAISGRVKQETEVFKILTKFARRIVNPIAC